MAYSPTRKEQETVIRWNEEERVAHWYSSSATQIRRMDDLAARYPEAFTLQRRSDWDVEYSFDPRHVKITRPAIEEQTATRHGTALRTRSEQKNASAHKSFFDERGKSGADTRSTVKPWQIPPNLDAFPDDSASRWFMRRGD
jgi:hypothetical protein